ncbi:hypothetical protein KY290_013553 [Solanum tuberosum]|uniref:NB-ARC domain-containing protein n=1 Tax=Solanum tuberosum TaxID=4113 RepID=A0ABQ7VM07_SOLTU|nr:hypothetical protein KY289_013668 [Solanum tuberosum]KAH0698437.1 hypothetical protein KY284_012652 [Solanum tuberosum]KAH0719144.1 hypothetical protein KY285_015175 [Solanum tuberosum]KAH0769572.1 hypothetical protein KY290_013553 [Solanum tuberosum]
MYAYTSIRCEINLVNLENGWKLLCDKVFGPEHDHPPELEEVGKEIVEKCQGLPLAILVTAGRLSKIPRMLEDWKDVCRALSKSIASHHPRVLRAITSCLSASNHDFFYL